MDEARLRALLRDLYAEGSRLTPRGLDPLAGAQARRRTIVRPVLATCAAVAAIAGLVVVLIPSTPDAPARLLPIEASPHNATSSVQPSQVQHSPQPSLRIDTSPTPPVPGAPNWVPEGAILRARSTFSSVGNAVLSYQLAGAANAHSGTSGLLQVWITPDAAGKAKLSSNSPTPGNSYLAKTVSAHPAILTVPIKGLGGFSVQWVANGQLMTVSMARDRTPAGITGASVDDLMRVAASIPNQ
jgi:hypothetical protein